MKWKDGLKGTEEHCPDEKDTQYKMNWQVSK
jgi:hypothetical protein